VVSSYIRPPAAVPSLVRVAAADPAPGQPAGPELADTGPSARLTRSGDPVIPPG